MQVQDIIVPAAFASGPDWYGREMPGLLRNWFTATNCRWPNESVVAGKMYLKTHKLIRARGKSIENMFANYFVLCSRREVNTRQSKNVLPPNNIATSHTECVICKSEPHMRPKRFMFSNLSARIRRANLHLNSPIGAQAHSPPD